MSKTKQQDADQTTELAVLQEIGRNALDIGAAENMVALLNREPYEARIKKNTMVAGHPYYLPIGEVEMQLDEIFFGLWQTRNFRTTVIANEIVGEIELGVYHPVLKQWIWRTGAAAVMIQQKKGADIMDISAKHKNTLVKDYAHLKAETIKNAAKSFGKWFGRDLNRKEYSPQYEPATTQMDVQEKTVNDVMADIAKAETVQQLSAIYKANFSTPGISQAIKERRQELMSNAGQ